LGFKISVTIHNHYKALKSQDIFYYNSDCVWLKEQSHTPRMAWGYVHFGIIFIFGWTNSL